jgi:alanine dehydrogenase
MPGAYSRSSTLALNNRTIRYGLKLASQKVEAACREDSALRNGLNMYQGWITFKPVADAFGLEKLYKPVEDVL